MALNFHNIEFATSFGLVQQLPESDKAEIVFAGRSNVGKSSMINKTFNRKQLARVSSVPGKTVTVNFFMLENLCFADLPGYGYAKGSKTEKHRWSMLVEGYFNSGRNIQLVFQLIDMRHPPTSDDLNMIEYLVQHEVPFVIILTKLDKLSGPQAAVRLEQLKNEIPYSDEITIIPFSAKTGQGVEQIHEILQEIADCDLQDSQQESIEE